MKQIYRKDISFQFGGVLYVVLLIMLAPWEWMLCWLAAVVAHELGHYIGFCILRIPINWIRCTEKGVFIETRPITPAEELCVASLGPIVSGMLVLTYKWVPLISICAGIHMVYNLLPLGENDGQRMVRSMLLLLGCGKVLGILMKMMSWISVAVLIAVGFIASVRLELGIIPLVVVFVVLLRTFPCKRSQQIVQ